MPFSYKVLGQQVGSNAIGTYSILGGPVPTDRSWIISTIVICNQAASAATYRLAVSSTTSPSTIEFIVYGATVPANDTVTLTLGITMEAGKYIMASASTNTMSFSAFGTEVS